MFQKQSKLLRAIIVAVIMGVLGYVGLNVPESVVEEAVETQLRDQIQSDETSQITTIPTQGIVTNVIDGDTFTVANAGVTYTVRLIGIDTPEVDGSPQGEECYGSESSQIARDLLRGQTVTLTTDPTQAQFDRFERLLAYATLPDGRDVGEALLTAGAAEEFTYDTNYAKQTSYQQAEINARADAAGLWSVCGN